MATKKKAKKSVTKRAYVRRTPKVEAPVDEMPKAAVEAQASPGVFDGIEDTVYPYRTFHRDGHVANEDLANARENVSDAVHEMKLAYFLMRTNTDQRMSEVHSARYNLAALTFDAAINKLEEVVSR